MPGGCEPPADRFLDALAHPAYCPLVDAKPPLDAFVEEAAAPEPAWPVRTRWRRVFDVVSGLDQTNRPQRLKKRAGPSVRSAFFCVNPRPIFKAALSYRPLPPGSRRRRYQAVPAGMRARAYRRPVQQKRTESGPPESKPGGPRWPINMVRTGQSPPASVSSAGEVQL